MEANGSKDVVLTPNQQRFVEAYAGNGTEAAKLAGYQGDDDTLAVTASRLLRLAKVREAIQSRAVTELAPLIATRTDRQTFWSEIMNDPKQNILARLKASELLGKSEADFTEKVEHSGKVTLEELVAASREAESDE